MQKFKILKFQNKNKIEPNIYIHPLYNTNIQIPFVIQILMHCIEIDLGSFETTDIMICQWNDKNTNKKFYK